MRMKWTDDDLRYLRKGIKQTEQADKANEWGWWLLFGALVVMEVIVIGKILMSW